MTPPSDELLKQVELLNRLDPRHPDEESYFCKKSKPVLGELYRIVTAQAKEIELQSQSLRECSSRIEQLESSARSHDKTVERLNARIVEEIDRFNRLQNIVSGFEKSLKSL